MQREADGPEDEGLIARIGPLEIDWPKTIGYFGGVWLAVRYGLIAPSLGLFIAAIPVLKLLKHPNQPMPLRIVSDLLEGAAKPVGGDAEATTRLAQAEGGATVPSRARSQRQYNGHSVRPASARAASRHPTSARLR